MQQTAQPTALNGLRVLELGGEIAPAYCTRLLALLGADVLKVEGAGGDPLRAAGPFPHDEVDTDRGGAVFRALNRGKRTVSIDVSDAANAARLAGLFAWADVIVEALGDGELERLVDLAALARVSRPVALVRLSAFGQGMTVLPGDDIVSALGVQALAGGVNSRYFPGHPPVPVGARADEYVVGTYAAVAALTGVAAARRSNALVTADVSAVECIATAQTVPMVFSKALTDRGLPRLEKRVATLPGLIRCKDGFVGLSCLTNQHWVDVCHLLGVADWIERQPELIWGGELLNEFMDAIAPWLQARTVEEIVEIAQAMRIPAAPMADAAQLLECEQFAERPYFELGEDGTRLAGPPWRLSRTPALPPPPLRQLSVAEVADLEPRPEADAPGGVSGPNDLPYEGLRVLELGHFVAGTYPGQYLAAVGADVVKIESVQRPDAYRFVAVWVDDGPDWIERGPNFQAANIGKRDVTLDFGQQAGRDLLLRLVATADVLVENYSARVLETLGLSYQALKDVNPDLIMVRMPAFGLAGPWKDRVGWAIAIEQAAGMVADGGSEDRPLPPGFIDYVNGMHAVVAIQAALDHLARTGEGQQIEVAQVEVGINLITAQLADWQLNGRAPRRLGARDERYAPQGVYPATEDAWIAITVRDDDDWHKLAALIGADELTARQDLAGLAGRQTAHDEIDALLGEWTQARDADTSLKLLWDAGVPAALVVGWEESYDEPHLVRRRFFQAVDTGPTGLRRMPGWPMRYVLGDVAHRDGGFFGSHPHFFGRPVTLGQDNAAVLGGELGLGAQELAALEEANVIGTRPLS